MSWLLLSVYVFLGLLLLVFVLWLLYGQWSSRLSARSPKDLKGLLPVTQWSLPDYTGRWYEHYRLNSAFERPEDEHTTATYKVRGPTLQVINESMRKGRPRKAIGRAWRTQRPGALQVSFFPFVEAPYVVLGLKPSRPPYQTAIVGSPNRSYLWMLGRTPTTTADDRAWLEQVARTNGYPEATVARLQAVNQKG